MGKTHPLRGLALIAVIPLAVSILSSVAYGQAPIVSYDYGGYGVFPRFATANSQYYLRVTYNRNGNHASDPILAFQIQGRSQSPLGIGTINLLPWLDAPAGVGFHTGIQLSPGSGTLISNVVGTTTGDGDVGGTTLMASRLAGNTGDYVGEALQVTSVRRGPANADGIGQRPALPQPHHHRQRRDGRLDGH
jgi:hypothetical protein